MKLVECRREVTAVVPLLLCPDMMETHFSAASNVTTRSSTPGRWSLPWPLRGATQASVFYEKSEGEAEQLDFAKMPLKQPQREIIVHQNHHSDRAAGSQSGCGRLRHLHDSSLSSPVRLFFQFVFKVQYISTHGKKR